MISSGGSIKKFDDEKSNVLKYCRFGHLNLINYKTITLHHNAKSTEY
ncbi:hypothetical protein NEICINOT_04375 [Neisseria cinerea ATCC 14685]|uniref:Uncharacterized protein n=1 Tax=Neisseria cinerea ATCC 14685 TaxID=546262 RepID=D0W3Y2_NEICI|nr:hypothetical protein NEICINOT_04375 [Neisseria cinerea ATCC 14685]